jgi:CRP/FNR family transcriptional regulator, polysaccharide utilization system transcription regulator
MKKIVLIEDNLDLRETTQEILELADYKVFTAKNGKEGVAMTKAEKPDLVICDIMMPDLDGYGVLRILTKNPETSRIPFIFLSAKADKSEVRQGMNLGADDYITKPFEEAELLEAIEIRLKRSENLKKEFQADINGLNEFMNEARGVEELKGLSYDRKIRAYNKKEVIYREGDYANYLYFISNGKVKCIQTDDYGKDFMTDVHQSGEFIGYLTLLEDGEYHETAISMENTEVSVIPKKDFLDLIQNNRAVATKFIKMLSGNVQDREKRLLQLAYAPVRERVAIALLKLKTKEMTQNGTPANLKLSREDLASIVGTAKESLIRTLSELKKEGLLETEGQEIIILDESGLKKAAGGF